MIFTYFFPLVSLDLCQHIINEMNFLTTYAARIYERASYSNNVPIIEYLNETMSQVSRDIQSVVGRTQANSAQLPMSGQTLPPAQHPPPPLKSTTAPGRGSANITPEAQEMFQKFLTFLQMNNNQPPSGNGGDNIGRANGNNSNGNGEHHFSS